MLECHGEVKIYAIYASHRSCYHCKHRWGSQKRLQKKSSDCLHVVTNDNDTPGGQGMDLVSHTIPESQHQVMRDI